MGITSNWIDEIIHTWNSNTENSERQIVPNTTHWLAFLGTRRWTNQFEQSQGDHFLGKDYLLLPPAHGRKKEFRNLFTSVKRMEFSSIILNWWSVSWRVHGLWHRSKDLCGRQETRRNQHQVSTCAHFPWSPTVGNKNTSCLRGSNFLPRHFLIC